MNGLSCAFGFPRGTRSGRRLALGVLALLLLLSAAGCSPGDPPAGFGAGNDHGDILIASSAPGGGTLVADYDFDQAVEVAPAGGFEDILLFTATDPGWMMLEEDEPGEGVFVLNSGTAVSLEVTAITPGVSLLFDKVRVSQMGEALLLGETPELHGHGVFQVAVPDGDDLEQDFLLGFRLTTDSPEYASSPGYTLRLRIVEDGENGHEHED
jgi:hypothetical protein